MGLADQVVPQTREIDQDREEVVPPLSDLEPVDLGSKPLDHSFPFG